MIETPEEFAQQVEKAIVHQYKQSLNGRGGMIMISKDYIPAGKLIAARDAAIRNECAERAIEWYMRGVSPELVELYKAGLPGLKAAIMGDI